MERESFSDPATAADLARAFVAVKVDREERPDIDALYMDAVQAMTGQGGWPMSVFLTPDGRPFYGGTYFPDTPRHGMPSFRQLLARIEQVWREDRAQVEASATRIADHVRSAQRGSAQLAGALDLEAATGDDPLAPATVAGHLRSSVEVLAASFDARHGGFGGAPKFPPAVTLELLLRLHVLGDAAAGDGRALAMATRTLDAMADGGIYDHLGGGFARYATDRSWLVPHFEKMLYDNAQLARVYVHAWQVSGEERYREVARETLDFMARDLRHPADGAFASSLDADTHGVEGATYTWTAAEIRSILGADAPLFEAAYGVTAGGNWEGRTILSRVRDDTVLAADLGVPRSEVAARLAAARAALLAVRVERPQPARDDKVLTSWNGLAIGAFADAGRAFGDERYSALAGEAADFVLARLRTDSGRLLRSWKDGRAQHAGVLEDHAHLADGLLALYEATFEERWYAAARDLMDVVLEHFADPEGGFHDTADDAETLIARPRSLQDNALPSGGAMASLVLLRLAALTGERRYRAAAEQALAPMAALGARHPGAFPQWLLAVQLAAEPIDEVAIVGRPAAPDTRALLAVIDERPRPRTVVAVAEHPEASVVPLLRGRTRIGERATAYVCRGFACRRPVDEPSDLAAQLAATQR